MQVYAIVSAAVVVISSIALAYVLKKNNLLRTDIFLAIVLSSAVASLLFPAIYGTMLDYGGFFNAGPGVVIAFALTLAVHVTLIFLLSMAISLSVSEDKLKNAFKKIFCRTRAFPHAGLSAGNIPGGGVFAENMPAENAPEKSLSDENILEIPVDTVQNIDKMRLEKAFNVELGGDFYGNTNGDEGEKIDGKMDLDIKECIDEAFRLKEQGDLESAILYYMYALDKKPEDDVAFWIIIDICVLYKALGQTELAKNLLEGYADKYGNIMNESVKAEIENNLQ